MPQSRLFRQKTGGQGQKNVTGGTLSANIQKLILIFYSLIKMTQGVNHLELDPDSTKTSHTYKFIETQCLNIPHIQQLALKIGQPLPQLNLPLSDKFAATILEEHLHYANQYADMLELKVNQLEFVTRKRLYTFGMQALMRTFGRVAMAIITLVAICQTAPVSTIQGLHNMLLYIWFRKEYGWLQSGFRPKQYAEMETTLMDAIIQLRQIATPPTTTTTEAPIYQTNDERIHGILQTFINKTLDTAAEEREEKKQASGLTKQQEQMYATE
jgi:hypothetical protein